MKVRNACEKGEVRETEKWRMMARDEDAEEDDDNATLQDCLDRQRKVTTVRTKSKRIALTPLDDEDSMRRVRKKCKGIQELLAAAKPATSPPCGEIPYSPMQLGTGDNEVKEGKNRKVKKKRRRIVGGAVEGEGNNKTVDDAVLHYNIYDHIEDVTSSELSRKIFILVAKVEKGDGQRHGPVGTSDNQLVPGKGTLGVRNWGSRLVTEDLFLPVDGYHTCGDADNCPRIPCLEKVLDQLDKMSEEELKLWYRAVIGEVFVSRNGEKVRGRLRRMIRCKVKEFIMSQCSGSTMSSHSWRSSPEMKQGWGALSPTSKPVAAFDSLIDSPGSKWSASNAGDGSIGAEDAVCSGTPSTERSPLMPLSSSSEISRELTFQLPTCRSSFTEDASANSSVDDPEPLLQAVTARITRSKARGLVKLSGIEQGDLNRAQCLKLNQDLHISSSNRNSPTTIEELEVPGFHPPVSLPGGPDRDAGGIQVEGAAAEQTDATLSRKETCAVEVVLGELSSRACCDLSGQLVVGAAEATMRPATRSRKSFSVQGILGEQALPADHSLKCLSAKNASAGTTTAASRCRKQGFAVEDVVREVSSSAGRRVSSRHIEDAAAETSAITTRSRKRRDLEQCAAEIPSSSDRGVVGLQLEAGAAEIETAPAPAPVPSGKKRFVAKRLSGEDSPLGDCSADDLAVDVGTVQSTAAQTRLRKKRESVAAEKVLEELCSPADCHVSGPPVETGAAEPTSAATRSRSSDVESGHGEVSCIADCDRVVSTAEPKTAVATRSRKKRGFVAADAEKTDVGVSSPADCGGRQAEGSAPEPHSRKTRSAVEQVLEDLSKSLGFSLADCDLSDLLAECAAEETTAAPSGSFENTLFSAVEAVREEVSSLADCDLIASSLETGGPTAETPPAAARKERFAVEKDFGEVSPSADCEVNGLPEESRAVETKADEAGSRDRESVSAEEVFGGVSTLGDCDLSGTSAPVAAVETNSSAVEKVPVEVSSSAGCEVNGLLIGGGGAEATAVATSLRTKGELVAAELVLGDVKTSGVIGFLVKDAAAESTRAIIGSGENRDIIAVEEVLGEFSSSFIVDCNVGSRHAAEECVEHIQPSPEARRDSGVQHMPSLSDVVMKLLSDSLGKSSHFRNEVTTLGSEESSGTVNHQSETESLIGTRVASAGEALKSNLIPAAVSPTSVTCSVREKVAPEMNDPLIEGIQLTMPSETQCESTISVCIHDNMAQESLMEIDGNSEPALVSMECTTNFSSQVANPPCGKASACKFEESSEVCCSVVVTISDIRTDAPSDLDTVCSTRNGEVEQGSATEGAQSDPQTIQSSSLVVCPSPLSGSVLEIASDCKLNTQCQDSPCEDFYACLPHQEVIAEPSDSFEVMVCRSSMPSSGSFLEDRVHLAAAGLRPSEAHLSSLATEHCRNEGEGMLLEIGDRVLFEQVGAERSSSLWPSEYEGLTYLPARNGCKMEDATECEPIVGAISTTSGGTGKWQLLSCNSRRSGESSAKGNWTIEVSCVPKAWRDAGEFLEELDSVYFMQDTERSSLLDSLRKIRYDDSDVGDDRNQCPGNAVDSDCVPQRKRQRVETSSDGRCAVTEKLVVEADDVWKAGGDFEYAEDVEQIGVERTGRSTSVHGHTSVHARTSSVSVDVEPAVNSQHHQGLRVGDERGDEGSPVDDEAATAEKDLAAHENCSDASLFRPGVYSSPPCLGDAYLDEPPLRDSPSSQSTSGDEGTPESVVKSDACVELLACERLVQEDDLDGYTRSSDIHFARKMEVLEGENGELIPSPPPSIPPIRLKLPSGRARHVASAVTKMRLESARDWRYSEAEALGGKPRATSAASVAINSSDEDSGDSSSEQEGSTCESAPTEALSGQELSLVLPPTSQQCSFPPPLNSCNSNSKQESISAPDGPLLPPCTKGILKSSPKCTECVELRFQARAASDFVASQMKTFGEVAGRLTREIQDLRSILETQISTACEGIQDETVMDEKVKSVSRSKDTERSAEKNLTLLLRDCKRFCKLTAKRPQRRIVFADEAGKKLCHVKTFESPPALARPLWEIL